jgi:hypothetical protein
MRKPIAMLPLVLVLGCSTPNKNDPNYKDKHGRNAEDAEIYAKAVEERRLLPGMHKKEIRAVMGGGPEKTRKIERGGTTYIMWLYYSRSLDLYLDEDGYLLRWTGIG